MRDEPARAKATALSELLLTEFDQEMAKTRVSLARVPPQPTYAPHAKSMPLGKLAVHLTRLAGFGAAILTTPEIDFLAMPIPRLRYESSEQLLGVFDQNAAASRRALAATEDSAWGEPWRLRAEERVLLEGTRFQAYRSLYVNHIIHHRAQLGVYLRLLGVAVPSTYGPSADES